MYVLSTYVQNENKSIIWWQRFSIKRENDAKGFLILLFFQTIKSDLTQINFILELYHNQHQLSITYMYLLRGRSLITLTRGGREDYWKSQSLADFSL